MDEQPAEPNRAAEPGNPEVTGEHIIHEWKFRIIEQTHLEPGDPIVLGSIDTAQGSSLAALRLIENDLRFSAECLREAEKLGLPDVTSISSKALIHAGVIAYARAFVSGVREVRLDLEGVKAAHPTFDAELHDYVLNLRNKHIAHSVNDFEHAAPTTVMRREPVSLDWKVSGIGIARSNAIGLPLWKLQRTILQLDLLITWVDTKIEAETMSLFVQQRDDFQRSRVWEMAPIGRNLDRNKISKRR